MFFSRLNSFWDLRKNIVVTLFFANVKLPLAVDCVFGLKHVGHRGVVHDDRALQRLEAEFC